MSMDFHGYPWISMDFRGNPGISMGCAFHRALPFAGSGGGGDAPDSISQNQGVKRPVLSGATGRIPEGGPEGNTHIKITLCFQVFPE